MSANVLVVTDAAPRTRTASSLMQAHAASFAMHRLSSIKDKGLGQTDHGGGKHLSNLIIVTGHSPHKETAPMLGIDDPEFFDCCFQR